MSTRAPEKDRPTTRAPQKRRLATRAKLLEVTAELVAEHGMEGLRVEDVVTRAGVAKGTLFSHFGDKDGLLAAHLGGAATMLLDDMADSGAPESLEALTDRLMPLFEFLASDRIVFDLMLRYSGTTGTNIDAAITQSFYRQIDIFAGWVSALQATSVVRNDQPVAVLAEGIQAFLLQVLATEFCMSVGSPGAPRDRLHPFLTAWLSPTR